MAQASIVLRTTDLKHSYGSDVNFDFPDIECRKGDHLLITGNSGVGKTTLLHLLGGLLRAERGKIEIAGTNIVGMKPRELDSFRGKHLGLIFQQPRFIRSLNVLDNVLTAQFFGNGKTSKLKAVELLSELDIDQLSSKMTHKLSGGERQRLAIACALSTNPELVLADEPTSSLDDLNAQRVYKLLVTEASKNNATLVVVSHDGRLKSEFQNMLSL